MLLRRQQVRHAFRAGHRAVQHALGYMRPVARPQRQQAFLCGQDERQVARDDELYRGVLV